MSTIRQVRFVMLMASTAIAVLLQGFFAPPASAAACPPVSAHDFVSTAWNTTSATGVEAPVQLRKNGTICAPNTTEADQDSSWISLEPTDGSAIVQMGFIHFWNYAIGSAQFCRFWATGGGAAHVYKCGSDASGAYVFFKIYKFYDTDSRFYYYNLLDCGSTAYTACTSYDASQRSWASSWGIVAAETTYGGVACTDRIMGTSAAPANVGTSSYGIKWQSAVGGTFATKTLSDPNATCSHYVGVRTNSILSTWDNRN
jgi:hypothetical protein